MNATQIKKLHAMKAFDAYLESVIDYDQLEGSVSEHVVLEYQWRIDQCGKVKACQDYVQGLPSWINNAFTNYDILKEFYKLSDADIDFVDTYILIDHYWDYLGRSLSKRL